MLGVQNLVHLLEIECPALEGRHREAAGHDGELAALALGEALRVRSLGRGRPLAHLDRAERLEQPLDRHVTLLDRLRGDDRKKPAESLLAQPRGDRDWLGPELSHDHVRARAPADRQLPRETLEEDEAPRVEVRARRRRPTAELLGRRVARRAHHLVRLGDAWQRPALRLLGKAAEAEVEHERVPAYAGARHHDVVGLQVPVHHAARVRTREGIEDLHHQMDGVGHGELALGRENLAQGGTRHVFEHGVQHPVVGLARVNELHDARM